MKTNTLSLGPHLPSTEETSQSSSSLSTPNPPTNTGTNKDASGNQDIEVLPAVDVLGSEIAPSQHLDPLPQLSPEEFAKIFNHAYNEFYRKNSLSKKFRKVISAQDVNLEQFDRLTLGKSYQRYISLLGGHIIFHEVPNAPHGEVIEKVKDILRGEINHNTFQGCSDNDIVIGSANEKWPDASFRIRKSQIPNSRPPWMKLLPHQNPFSLPYPSIVVEVEINNESPAVLQMFANR